LGRRTQKVYADILGRAYKSEILNWNNTVYSSTQTTFNGRDQATLVRRYAGTTSSSTYQDTTFTYDGHGRSSTRHIPRQSTGANTSYIYNADDSIQKITDGRGAATNYTYNSRGLATQISYTTVTGVQATSTVSFTYDNIGNRTQMTDGMGTVDYTYNQLSQMTSETRDFTDTLADAPISGSKFKLEYTYSPSGQLKSYKDPYGQQINYAFDKAGRLSSVTGSTAFNGITTYANNPIYTARNILKSVSYGNGTQMNITSFNNKLQATGFEVKKGTDYVHNKTYNFYGDGSLKKLDDQLANGANSTDTVYDRFNKYDHVGRIIEAKSGAEARGGTVAQSDMQFELPYRQSFQYNEFNNMTQRNNLHWGIDYWDGKSFNNTYTYTNNRLNGYYIYDADGRLTGETNTSSYIYDVAGNLTYKDQYFDHKVTRSLDGHGQEVKREKEVYYEEEDPFGGGTTASWKTEDPIYYIRSTVFGGQVISETNSTGKKLKTFVKAAGTTIAWQTMIHGTSSSTDVLYFEHIDPSGMSRWMSNSGGTAMASDGEETSIYEADGKGNNVGYFTPYFQWNTDPLPDEGGNSGIKNVDSADAPYVNGQRVTGTIDGVRVSWGAIQGEIESGRIGGIFGLVQMAAEQSRQIVADKYEYGYIDRTETGRIPVLRNPDGIVSMLGPNESVIVGVWASWSPVYNNTWQNIGRLTLFRSPNPLQDDSEPLPSKEQMKELLKRRQDLNNGECRKFLEKVLSNLKIPQKKNIGNSFEDLFDYLTVKKGVDLVRVVTGKNVGGTSHHGNKAPHPIGFQALPKAETDADRYQIQMRYVGVLIHEMLHRVGKSHSDMRNAGFKALSSEEQKNFVSTGTDTQDFSKMINTKCKVDVYNEAEREATMIKNVE
jgi:YD repeat-containing protein